MNKRKIVSIILFIVSIILSYFGIIDFLPNMYITGFVLLITSIYIFTYKQLHKQKDEDF
jgi:uncharacterized membrane protein YkvI